MTHRFTGFRLLFLVLILIVLLSMKCAQDAGKIDGVWQLESYLNLKTDQSETAPQNLRRPIILEFSSRNDTLFAQGQTVSNIVKGSFEIKANKQIRTIRFGGTKVGEPEWGQRFWNAMSTAVQFEVSSDQLKVYFDSGRQAAIFTPTEKPTR